MLVKDFLKYIHKETIVELVDYDKGWLVTCFSKMIPSDYLNKEITTIYPDNYKDNGDPTQENKLILVVKEGKDD